jgi:hypothetical protein
LDVAGGLAVACGVAEVLQEGPKRPLDVPQRLEIEVGFNQMDVLPAAPARRPAKRLELVLLER